MTSPAPEITSILEHELPGRALDIACGNGRHAAWLAAGGWKVTATDQVPILIPGVAFTATDLEQDPYPITPAAWDLIVCWLYWQPNLLPAIAEGVRPGGIVALAGKTTGRFATSLANYRQTFPNWAELSTAETLDRAHFIARRPDQSSGNTSPNP